MTYYAMKQTIGRDGKVTAITETGDKSAMRRQFRLFCDSCSKNEAGDRFTTTEWGTVDGDNLERRNPFEQICTSH